MTATAKILEQLAPAFAALDAEVLTATQEWARGRVAALREFKASDEAKTMRRDQSKYYSRLFALAGGKTWYNVFDGRSQDMIAEFVAKNCAATVEQRNARIADKLAKAGVNEIKESAIGYTRDGFDGNFRVDTDTGQKRVKVETIRAGGYNIQCLHLRVLVKVSE